MATITAALLPAMAAPEPASRADRLRLSSLHVTADAPTVDAAARPLP